jgi:hypothetical protein
MGVRILLIAFAALALLVSGCCGQTIRAPSPGGSGGGAGTGQEGGTDDTGAGVVETPPQDDDAEGGNGAGPGGETDGSTILDVGDTTGGGDDWGSETPASSQADCATMTPTCSDCVAKQGCGWCKSRNGCFSGSAGGPGGDVTCEEVNWAFSESACAAPVGGEECASKTNCADCMSGSGCKWCQEGTKCVDASSSETCGAGGWRTKIYMCYAGQ